MIYITKKNVKVIQVLKKAPATKTVKIKRTKILYLSLIFILFGVNVGIVEQVKKAIIIVYTVANNGEIETLNSFEIAKGNKINKASIGAGQPTKKYFTSGLFGSSMVNPTLNLANRRTIQIVKSRQAIQPNLPKQ